MSEQPERPPSGGDVVDSPTGWVKKHIDSYVATDGEDGHRWRGVQTLLITTVGRRTGTRHRTALIYGRDGDDYLVVASKGGHPNHPSWYLNLVANPRVGVQVGGDKFEADAATVEGIDRPAAWSRMAEIFPMYDHYQRTTARKIPVVRLRRVA